MYGIVVKEMCYVWQESHTDDGAMCENNFTVVVFKQLHILLLQKTFGMLEFTSGLFSILLCSKVLD